MQNITKKLESFLGVKKSPSPEEQELFQKTRDFVQSIKWIPGLRMVAVSNSLAMYATHKESDIDLFIVTAPRRLWIVRTLVLSMATLLGVRTKLGNEAGKFCFPFFITDKNLSLKEIAIENDVYMAYWISSLKPIYNQYYTYGRFMEVNKVFYEDTLQLELSEEERANLLRENRIFLLLTQRYLWITQMGEFFAPFLSFKDTILGFVSKKLIAKRIPTDGTEGILVNDDMVKLHINDRRKEIRDRIFSDRRSTLSNAFSHLQ
ncbi:MAG: hypothetical protein PHN60_02890 [Candidatus Gracilibacteria bacterium]|nr:hypothetical protein [Candidatus Gracilibacteria bacterium]